MLTLLAASAQALDCRSSVAAQGGFEPPVWDQILERLQNEGVIAPVEFSVESRFFGFRSDGPLGDISLGTLSERQFLAGLEAVQSTVPGLIYTNLLTKWASLIEEDYGAPYGQLFFLFLLNPEQRPSDTVSDVGLEVGQALFRNVPSIVDLAMIRSQALEVSFARWEKGCWASVSRGFTNLEHDLTPRAWAFDRVDRKVQQLDPRVFYELSGNRRRRHYELSLAVNGTENVWGETRPFSFKLREALILSEIPERARAPFVLLDLWDYGNFPARIEDQLAARAEFDGQPIGGALALKPDTARVMLSDLKALRTAVTEAFSQ